MMSQNQKDSSALVSLSHAKGARSAERGSLHGSRGLAAVVPQAPAGNGQAPFVSLVLL